MQTHSLLRRCLRDPIPEIGVAAQYLDDAVTAYLEKDFSRSKELIRQADMPIIRDWTESIWGKNSPYLQYRPVEKQQGHIGVSERVKARMPSAAEKSSLHARDGYHCRFCGIPVIRKEVRVRIMKALPDALPWGKKNSDQHAAFQAMWAQYDHVVPHSKGGTNDIENLVVTCAPCNFGRMSYSLEDLGLADPRMCPPVKSSWNGLERFL